MSDALETKAKFGRRIGVSGQRVGQMAKRGQVVTTDGGRIRVNDSLSILRAAGKLPQEGDQPEPEAADPALDSLSERLAQGEMLTWSEAQRAKENFLARLRQLEYEQKAGELVPIDDVEREHASRCQRIRSRLLALPHQAAPRAAGQDAIAIKAVLDDIVREALEELSGVKA